MDVEALISAVYSRPPIWNKKAKLHSNRSKVDRCWNEVAIEMNHDEEALRKKWKYLRDNFAVEYGKILARKMSDDPGKIPKAKWIYIKPLEFLKDSVIPRSPFGAMKSSGFADVNEEGQQQQLLNRSSTAEGFEAGNGDENGNHASTPAPSNSSPRDSKSGLLLETGNGLFSDDAEENERDSPGNDRPGSIPAPRAAKRRRTSDNFYDRFLGSGKRKSCLHCGVNKTLQTAERSDTDLMFFRTLLPHVKLIPQHLKLRFQSRVQAVVQEFAYPEPRPVGLYQSHSQGDLSSGSISPAPSPSNLVEVEGDSKEPY